MNQSEEQPGQNLDLPIGKLVPLYERIVNQKRRQRLAANVRAVGLIAPLIVYPEGDHYMIVDGCLRYRILLEMGVETVPCQLGNGPVNLHLDA